MSSIMIVIKTIIVLEKYIVNNENDCQYLIINNEHFSLKTIIATNTILILIVSFILLNWF